ncbi:Med26 domain containing protein-like protein [Leptotrombidium deliense]|uniref:Med26 domain containing protein-like protein n=1 Tax=Leptotrombidium deliense TaxID=299467 RepID=A0A443SD79_9ACAR|nr:Med26 domain containing protein-like protein [Leptotrombidium deliense]
MFAEEEPVVNSSDENTASRSPTAEQLADNLESPKQPSTPLFDENSDEIPNNSNECQAQNDDFTDEPIKDEHLSSPISDHLSIKEEESMDNVTQESIDAVDNDNSKEESSPQKSNLIADIFGESEGEEEFEGFEKRGKIRSEPLREQDEHDEKGDAVGAEAEQETNAEAALPELSSDESEDEASRKRKLPDDFVYDFDIMMQKRKESFRRRKRKNIDIINDSDDVIAELIQEMKQAAEDDFQLNKDRKAATRKLKLLPVVETQLRKIDLREAFLDAGVLSVITDWLTPLPDRSLPNLQVRETLIKLLSELNIMDVERLKASGIGKAIMYLFKHPKETKENKRRAGALISTWARPIFNLDSDFHSMSKEEREQRDFEHMTKTKRRVSDVSEGTPPSRQKTPDEKTLRPGEKGWIPRARVPMPSTRDYVVRPKSSVETEASRSGNKKVVSRFDKYLRTFREKNKQTKSQRAVPISIEGRKMSL